MSNISEILGVSQKAQKYNRRLFGLELELEQYNGCNKDIPNILQVTEDNSLRNNGREFISNPITLPEAVTFFTDVLHTDRVSWADPTRRCTERGSIHVHVNVLHLDEAQVRDVLRLYCLLEAGFFNAVESHRQNNIYCVPLSATGLPRKLAQNTDVFYIAEQWHKYTALNAKPMVTLGTIEFRHLQATENPTTFMNWLGYINNLFDIGERDIPEQISFPQLMDYYLQVFERTPTDEVKAKLMLAHQEDIVSHCSVGTKTLISRIKNAKQGTTACAA